jgi:SAM-dependent methyltransferase
MADNNPPQEPSQAGGFSYFQIQGMWGVTKHFGGVRASERLAERCHIGKNSYVLEVGCGTGLNACRLVETTGTRVMGIDLSEQMVAWSQRRAERKGLSERARFKVADAQDLPFEDGTFDAMLCESVTAFVPDKLKALGEYRRVVKPGGYAGLNEGTWLHEPPTDLVAYVRRTMSGVDFQFEDGWCNLLEAAGFTDVQAEVQELSVMRQRLDEMQGLDRQDYADRLRAVGMITKLMLKDPSFRGYIREIMPSRSMLRAMFKYLGYGLYTGKV